MVVVLGFWPETLLSKSVFKAEVGLVEVFLAYHPFGPNFRKDYIRAQNTNITKGNLQNREQCDFLDCQRSAPWVASLGMVNRCVLS